MFDPSVYYPIPGLTADAFASLIEALLKVAPKNPPEHVKLAIDSLGVVLSEAKSGFVTRIDENQSTRIERAFDTFVDHVWIAGRGRLEFHALYNHEGAAMFTDEDRAELDFEDRVEKARKAAEIYEHLFGNGVRFLRAPFPQQSTHTGARIEWLETKGYWPIFEELVSPELASLLKVCQRRYKAMVTERGSRDGKSLTDLRELRELLRCELYAYCGAIGTLYDRNEPETAKVVQNALRPILVARAQSKRKPSVDTDGDGMADVPDDEVEGELLGDEQPEGSEAPTLEAEADEDGIEADEDGTETDEQG